MEVCCIRRDKIDIWCLLEDKIEWLLHNCERPLMNLSIAIYERWNTVTLPEVNAVLQVEDSTPANGIHILLTIILIPLLALKWRDLLSPWVIFCWAVWEQTQYSMVVIRCPILFLKDSNTWDSDSSRPANEFLPPVPSMRPGVNDDLLHWYHNKSI
jgi:hypothetical protein